MLLLPSFLTTGGDVALDMVNGGSAVWLRESRVDRQQLDVGCFSWKRGGWDMECCWRRHISSSRIRSGAVVSDGATGWKAFRRTGKAVLANVEFSAGIDCVKW